MNPPEKAAICINGVMHVLFLFSILTFFFFAHVKSASQKVYREQVDEMIDSQIQANDCNPQVRGMLQEAPVDWGDVRRHFESRKESEEQRTQNKWILRAALTFILLLSILLAYLAKTHQDSVDISELAKQNAPIYLLITVIHVIFFASVGKNYIPIKPSGMSQSVMEQIKYEIKNPS